jgi:PAS domain S-box-containing protein
MSRSTGGSIRVLHVDDEPELVDLAATFLERANDELAVVGETSVPEAMDRLAAERFDCIVSDYDMPDVNGLEFLEQVRERHPELPFILFTGKGSEEIASEAISAGVTDYLQKEAGSDQYTVLANRIDKAVSATRAKEALAESERMLSTLIGNLPGMVYRCRNEPDWPMEFVSEGCEALTGYDADAIESDEVVWGEDILHPEDRDRTWEVVQSALDDGRPFEVTYRIETSDGETRWLWEQGQGVYERGELVALEGFITDITERKAAEERRRKYETIVESMEDAAYILDEAGRFEFVNEAFVDSIDIDPADLVGEDSRVFADRADAAERDRYEELLEQLIDGEREQVRAQFDLTIPGEGERTINLRLTRLEDDGQFEGIVGVARDLTERQQRVRELEAYRMLVETVGDPMYMLDDEDVIEMVNDAALDTFGYERAELVGHDIAEFMDPDDVERGSEIIVDLLKSDVEDDGRFEFTVETAQGGTRWIENNHAPITEDGEFVGSVGVLRDITDRKERERELERYEALLQAAGDPVYGIDAEGTVTMANQAAGELFGADVDDLVGTDVDSLLPADVVEKIEARLSDLLAEPDRTRDTFEVTIPTVDGSRRQFEVHTALLEESTPEFRGSVGILREVTERSQRERDLERYEQLVENVGDPMYALDESAYITTANEAMADHLDCTVDDLAGEHVSKFLREEDVETGTELIADLIADDERRWATFEMETISIEGERTRTEDKIAILTDEDGSYTGSVGVIRDISDRKERERELERYETIIQAVGDPVYALDAEGTFTFVNDAIEDITGYPPEEVVGEHVSKVMISEDIEAAQSIIQELLASSDQTKATFEMDLVHRDGTHTPMENHAALLPFDDGERFRGTAGIVRDISERLEREQRLEQFASVVSHDLRNPLNVIAGRVEIAYDDDDPKHLEAIEDSVDRMQRLIDDLLTLARKGQTVGETEPVDLDDLVALAWDGVQTGDATLSVESPLGTTEADRERLRELLENLFRNAIEHTDGSPTVRVGPTDQDAGDEADGDRTPAGFYVADDGPGIPPDERVDVFEHGYSRSEDGSGFGLSIVGNVARAHDWQVTVSDSWAGGARFQITDLD